MPTLNLQVNDANDDGFWSDNGSFFSSASITGNYDTPYYDVNSFHRFTVSIPKGARITSAVLKFTAYDTYTSSGVNTTIKAIAADNASYPTDATTAEAATRTTASVDWNAIGNWSGSVEYSSPDISSVIQEIVDRSGWTAGNYIVLYWENNGSTVGEYRRAINYNASPTQAAKLDITFTLPSSGPNYPSTGTGENDFSDRATWTNAGNLTASDDARASTGYTITGTMYLAATGFGFSIPSDAVITGIKVTYERYEVFGSGHAQDENIYLVKDGTTPVGSNKAATGVNWNQYTEATFDYGSLSDLWGTTWTASEINSSNFGVKFRGTCTGFAQFYIDSVAITVYYTLTPPADALYLEDGTSGVLLENGTDFLLIDLGVSTYNVTMSDGVKSGDTNSNLITTTRTVSDGCKPGDTNSNLITATRTISDGVKSSDTLTTVITTIQLVSDGCKPGDTNSNLITATRTVSDGAKSGDTETNTLTLTKTVSDGAKSGDTNTNLINVSRTVSDGAKSGDTLTTVITTTQSVSDGAKSGDTYNYGSSTYTVTVSDGVKSGDTNVGNINISKAVSDGVKSSDTLANLITVTRTVSDGVKSSDTNSNLITVTRTTSDGVKSSDTLSNTITIIRTISDGGKSGDTWPYGPSVYTVTMSEGVKSSDTLTTIINVTRTVSDGSKSGDTKSNTLTLTKTVSDGVKSSDTLDKYLIVSLVVSDGVKSSDTLTTQISAFNNVSEGSKSSDTFFTRLDAYGLVANGTKAGDAVSFVYIDPTIATRKTLTLLGTRIGSRQMNDG